MCFSEIVFKRGVKMIETKWHDWFAVGMLGVSMIWWCVFVTIWGLITKGNVNNPDNIIWLIMFFVSYAVVFILTWVSIKISYRLGVTK